VKAHTGIEGNNLAEKLAKEAAEDDGELKIVYNRIPITTIATELKKEGALKMAETMGKHQQRSAMRVILPDSRTETETENTIDIGVHSYCLWP